jgi:hypothetical protein
MLEALTETKGRNFWVKTNNTTTESTVSNQQSKSKQVNEEWKIIQDLLLKLQCDITEERVESENNDTDCLSRGRDSEKDIGERIKIKLPEDLIELIEEI